MLVGINVGLK